MPRRGVNSDVLVRLIINIIDVEGTQNSIFWLDISIKYGLSVSEWQCHHDVLRTPANKAWYNLLARGTISPNYYRETVN